MASETLVAKFDTAGQAKAAIVDLKEAGVPSELIEKRLEEAHQESQQPSTQPSVTSRGGFFSWLGADQGSDQHQTHSGIDHPAIATGPILVTVGGNDAQLDTALSVLEEHSPTDIEQHFAPTIVDE